MKKLFTLFVALFAMIVCANAQTIFTEGFEDGTVPTGWTQIDADGDGYGWDNCASTLGAGYGHNGSDYCLYSQSYDNSVGALTPDNWLITPAINLNGNCNLKFYVCGQDANYAAEHFGVYISTTNASSTSNFTLLNEWTVGQSKDQSPWEQKLVDLSAYAGQTVYIAFRHFNVTDEYWLELDDVTIFAQPTGPTVDVDASSLNLGNVLSGSYSTASTSVYGYNLNGNITATTTAPFAVSADGNNYSTTATLPAAGGTIYVKFAPTAGGDQNGTVTLSAAGATDATIAVSGYCIVCNTITNFPFHEDFEPTSSTLPCWEIVDVDGNADEGFGEITFMGFDDANLGVAAYFYDAAVAGNDWLISPEMTLPANMCATFQYMATGMYPEKFSAYVIPQGSTYANAINVLPTRTAENTDWEMAIIDLSAYANQTVKVAIKVESDPDNYWIIFDEFNVMLNTGINEADNSARIYPNPAKNNVNVEASSIINNVEIFNMMGQRVASIDANDVTVNINTTNLNSGVYMMKVNTENGVINKKFTVAR